MSRHVPSRSTLRHLARLCNPNPNASAATITPASHPIQHAPRPAQRRPQTQHRYLSTSSSAQQTPSSTQPTQPHPPPSTSTPLPNIQSYYTLFPTTLPDGPPPTGPFAIPLPSLRQEFLRLQSLYHPDKYQPPATPNHTNPTSATPTQTNLSALSTLLNSAYRTLSSPLLRAQYLLFNQHGIDVTSEDTSTHTPPPAGVLMEVMETQEAIESSRTQGEIDELKVLNKRRIAETEGRMGEAFERGDVQGARAECVRLKYWVSLQEGLDGWEGEGREVRLVH